MARRGNGGASLLAVLFVFAYIGSKCSGSNAPPASNDVGPATLQSVPPVELETNVDKRFVASRSLNQRDKPNGKIVGTLQQGTEVQVQSTSGGWARISGNGQEERWVSEQHLCAGEGCYKSDRKTSAHLFHQSFRQ